MRTLLPLVLLACKPEPTDEPPPIDLVTPLGADEARAGVLTDTAALIGGIGSEGRPGDVLLINDRVRFLIQDPGRSSGGLEPYGGGVLDADLTRHDGTADADLVIDWTPALDVGWLPEATDIEIVDDGIDSGEAVVRVKAREAAFTYFEGVWETPDRNPPRGLTLQTTYTLAAGSPLMKVETTITGGDDEVTTRPGDVLHAFPGIALPWVPGVGRAPTQAAAEDAAMLVHHEHGATLGIFADDADASSTPEASLDVLNFLISFTSLYEPVGTLAPGAERTWTRWWGVGPDPATLTDAWAERTGLATRTVTGRVTDGSNGIEGVWVNVIADDVPYTLAITDADGAFSADVPEGATVRFVADGAGSRIVDDLPAGAGDVSPLGHADVRAASLATVTEGATPTVQARGWGRTEGAEGDDLVLTPPATLVVRSEATDIFQVRARAVDPVPPEDAFGLPLPGGRAALAHARSGRIEVALEPGTYDLVVWAGTRFEAHREQVELTSGTSTEVDATDLTLVHDVPGWFLGDTHVHAAPSFDGKLSPTDRALVEATNGVDLWFASEHDVGVDHTRLVEALGLQDHLKAVGSQEVTPWQRGHVNIFPVAGDPDARMGGAWPWWEHLPLSTEAQFEDLLAVFPDVLVQVNHPFSPGMPALASWSPGEIGRPDFWWDGFAAIEVLVPGEDPKGPELYMDLTDRGLLVAPTGSSDSHDHTTNSNGLLATWFFVPDANHAGEVTDDRLVDAILKRRTVATNGPFLELDPLPGSVVGPDTTLDVIVHTPSWMPVDRVVVYRNGEVWQTVDVSVSGEASFDLEGDEDSSFVVVAEADGGTTPPGGRSASAVASAVLLDLDEDGWDPPKAPLLP